MEGFHVPFIPFVDVFGKPGTTPLAQIVRLGPKVNVGGTFALTVTANDADVAHWPAVGVNV